MQPEQLEAEQDEQPLDMEWVVPSLPRDTPLKHENSCSTSSDWQSGQVTLFPVEGPTTSFSNSDAHFKHLNSYIGIAASCMQLSIIPDHNQVAPRHQ